MKPKYSTLKQAYGEKIENYVPPVTLSLPKWRQYVDNGYNTLFGDAIVSGDTEMNGAVYQGHVRQNPFTAMN